MYSTHASVVIVNPPGPAPPRARASSRRCPRPCRQATRACRASRQRSHIPTSSKPFVSRAVILIVVERDEFSRAPRPVLFPHAVGAIIAFTSDSSLADDPAPCGASARIRDVMRVCRKRPLRIPSGYALACSNACSRRSLPCSSRFEPAWLDEFNPEQLAAATHPGGPLLILAGAGTGQDDDAVRARRLAGQRGGRAGADHAADVHAPRGARDAPAHSCAGRDAGGLRRRPRRHVSLGRAPVCPDARLLARADAGLRGARPRRCRRSDRPDPRGARARAEQAAVSAEEHAARHLLADGQLPAPLADVVAEAFPWCEEHVEAMAILFKAYTARKRSLGVLDLDDLLLYWRALAGRRGDRAGDRGRHRAPADRRVPGRQRPAGGHRPRSAPRSAAR